MSDCTTKLMAALLSGSSVDKVFRQEIENAVSSVLQSELEAFLGYKKYAIEGYTAILGTEIIAGFSTGHTEGLLNAGLALSCYLTRNTQPLQAGQGA